MSIYFSGSNLGYYASQLMEDYISAGAWPEDAIELTPNEVDTYYMKPYPDGKTLGSADGRPVWVDLPPISDESKVILNTQLKNKYMAEANHQVDVLTDATDPDIMGEDISPDDVLLLKAWKKYRVELSRVTEMLNPVWPTKPNV